MESRRKQKKRSTTRRLLLSIGLTLLMFSCIIVSFLGWKAWRLYQIGTSLQATQVRVETLLEGGLTGIDATELEEIIQDLRTDTVDLQTELRPLLPLITRLDFIPRYGPLLRDAELYLALADEGTEAAVTMIPSLRDVLSVLQDDANSGRLELLLGTIPDASGRLEEISPNVAAIAKLYDSLGSKEELPWAVRQYLPLVDQWLPYADEGIKSATIVPSVVGTDQPQTFLILVQNEDEIRGTGGFISGVAIAQVQGAQLNNLEFLSSTWVNANLTQISDQYEWPPEPHVTYMGLEYFILQDSNFWPDFPTSAEKAIELFQLGSDSEEPIQIDGVVAIDQHFIKQLLEGLGPVYVAEAETTVGSDNVTTFMRDAYRNNDSEHWVAGRRDFIGQLAGAMQERLFNDPSSIDVLKLSDAMINALETRHFQIYLRDDSAIPALADLGWDNRLDIPNAQDFLLILDNNFGYNKANGAVERSAEYIVSLNPAGSHTARLDLSWQHTGAVDPEPCTHTPNYRVLEAYEDLFAECYYNYLRIYPPTGSSLTDASQHPYPAEYFLTARGTDGIAKTAGIAPDLPHFENFILVEESQQTSSYFEYTLPNEVVQQSADGTFSYTLTVRKQAGLVEHDTLVSVVLPAGYQFVSASPTPTAQDARAITFDTISDRDLQISVAFQVTP